MASQKINDHSFWAGGKSDGSVFPKGVHHKAESSAEGDGAIPMSYPDTTEGIKRDQMKGSAKMRSHMIKEGYRN